MVLQLTSGDAHNAAMQIGVHLVRFTGPNGPTALGPMLASVGQAAEEAGVDNLSLMDHFFQLEFLGDARDPMLEGYTTLGFLAAHTRSVQLQLAMTGVTYRHPGLLAKIVATLDCLSGGRAVLGIGAAWYEREHLGLGVPFPPVSERFERLEETLQIVRQMWSPDDGPFLGSHYRLEETICSPQPLHRVPIMVGGEGERKTLRLVAKYGDACNVFAGRDTEHVAHKFEVLRGWCDELGRPYDDISRTVLYMGPVLADPAGFLEQMHAYADVGVQAVHVVPPDDDPVEFVRGLGERVVPTLKGL